MSTSKSSKMVNYINWRMRVTINDNRQLIGRLAAFDKHLNIVLCDCEEFRVVSAKKGKAAKEEKRTLGMVMLRGECIVSMAVEGPPPPEDSKSRTPASQQAGPGMGRGAGRGMPVMPQGASGGGMVMNAPPPGGMMAAPMGLQGPVAGMGAPSVQMMAPPQMMPHGMAPPNMGGMGPPPGFMGRGGPPPGFMGRGGPPPGWTGPPPQ